MIIPASGDGILPVPAKTGILKPLPSLNSDPAIATVPPVAGISMIVPPPLGNTTEIPPELSPWKVTGLPPAVPPVP